MKSLVEFINEEKKTTGAGCVEMVKTMIDHLLANPDYKGKDKDLWEGAAYFLYDYLKNLKPADYEKIVRCIQILQRVFLSGEGDRGGWHCLQ